MSSNRKLKSKSHNKWRNRKRSLQRRKARKERKLVVKEKSKLRENIRICRKSLNSLRKTFLKRMSVSSAGRRLPLLRV